MLPIKIKVACPKGIGWADGYFERQESAQRESRRTLRAGGIQRQCCVLCGTSDNLHMHHPDYHFPLLVVWLCASDHRRLHGGNLTAEEIRKVYAAMGVKLPGFRFKLCFDDLKAKLAELAEGLRTQDIGIEMNQKTIDFALDGDREFCGHPVYVRNGVRNGFARFCRVSSIGVVSIRKETVRLFKVRLAEQHEESAMAVTKSADRAGSDLPYAMAIVEAFSANY